MTLAVQNYQLQIHCSLKKRVSSICVCAHERSARLPRLCIAAKAQCSVQRMHFDIVENIYSLFSPTIILCDAAQLA